MVPIAPSRTRIRSLEETFNIRRDRIRHGVCFPYVDEMKRAGRSKRPFPFSEAAASEEARRTLRYVEPLSAARTKLADFFSVLLSGHDTG